MKSLAWRTALLLAVTLIPLSTLADGRGRHPGGGPPPTQWHGGAPLIHQHGGPPGGPGGVWRYGHRNGRLGWWWTISGLWYFYPGLPAYSPGYYPPLPGAAYWYYCSDPPGYYPYVSECWDDWQVLPAPPR